MEQRRMGSAALAAGALVLLMTGCTSESGVALSAAACKQLRVVEDNQSRAVTVKEAIRALIEVLPKELLDEAALFYYPYGGSVAGLDTSGTNAEKAGRVLKASLKKCE